MSDISELILAIVHPLVSHPEEVTLETDETDEFIEYHLSVHEDDIGRVIGKKRSCSESYSNDCIQRKGSRT